jgi:flagellar basal body-associated protein FliL
MLGTLLDRFREKGPSRPRSKAEMEKRRRFLIVLLIVAAVVSSVSVVGYGYYDTSVRPWNQRILKVNGTVFDMRDFVKMLRLNGVSSADYAQYVISVMEDNEISRQRLNKDFGVVISDEAVEEELRELLGMTDNSTEDEFRQAYKQAQDNLKTAGFSMGDFKKLYIKPMLISEELQKQIGDRDYPVDSLFEHAQVQALLITGADDAAQLRARWEAGEDFDTLAEEDSVSDSLRDTNSDNTAIMEWVAKGIKSAAFDSYAFAEVWSSGVISDPIQDGDDTGSYWLIRVVATEKRALSESDRDTLVGEAYSKWLEEAKTSEDNEIVNYLDKKGGTAMLNWALDHVTVSTS